jgi:hypothetical protein
MADETLHFPGQDAPEPEAPEVPAPAPDAPKAPETKTEEQPPAGDPPQDPPAEVPPTKPRSIYQDLKETRQEKNELRDVAIAALQAQGIELKGDETPEQLKSLLEQHKAAPPAPKPEVPAPSAPETPPADPLEAFAKEEGLDPDQLKRLTDIIAKRIPASQLSAEEKETLEGLKAFKAKADADEQRRTEDAAIQAEAPNVKKTLEIQDDGELAAVMAEVTRLAHTPQFADKEVDYIVFRNREALAKLVSPKKPSFEAGDQGIDPAPEAEPDLTKGSVTPEMVQRSTSASNSALEVRKAQ